MKNYFAKIGLVVLLGTTLTVSGCSTAWISTLDNILAAAAPALINILNIISIAKGQPLNAALAAKINVDAANVKTLAADFSAASASAAPTACAQLQAAVGIYSADETTVLSLANVSDPATQQKIEILSALVAGTVTEVLAVIPNCQQAATMRASLEKKSVPLPLSSFVQSYNDNLVVPVGSPAVDSFTRSHKIHAHSKLIRVLSLGHVN